MANNPKSIDYRMSKKMFDGILSTRNEEEKKMNPYTFVMNRLNSTGDIRGTVTHVSITL